MKFGIIGAGNLAFHLLQRAQACGIQKVPFYCRDEKERNEFSKLFSVQNIYSLNDFAPNSLVLLCIPDGEIENIASLFTNGQHLISLSGSFDISKIDREKLSTIYPFQSFSKFQKVDWTKICCYLEAKNNVLKKEIQKFCTLLEVKSKSLDAKDRKKLHLAAVFVNNFTNELFVTANEICEQNGLDFEDLIPLIEITLDKIKYDKAKNVQTGPAKRNDLSTIKEQLDQLSMEDQKLYLLLTNRILKRNQHDIL